MKTDFITSLCDSYRSLKRQYKDAYFFFKENGLCTLLNADASAASDMLGLPLRYEGGTPYIQFPAENIDTNLCALVKKGNRVAIIEPV